MNAIGFVHQMDDELHVVSNEGVVSASDGLPALVVGQWWKEKHHYIRRYQEIFSVGMSQKWVNRVYVDLFSGPGRCVVEKTGEEIDGSPMVATTGKKPFSACYFCDSSPSFVAALQQRLTGSAVRSSFFVGDANAKVHELVAELPDRSTSLGLAFLDPFGYELNFDTIATLTNSRRMDLMITFHTGYLRRFAEKTPDAYDGFFGRSSWLQEYKEERKVHQRVRSLLNVYENGLVSLGYDRNNIDDEILVQDDNHHLLYHLIFASKHPRGKEFWRKINRKSSAGQGRLF